MESDSFFLMCVILNYSCVEAKAFDIRSMFFYWVRLDSTFFGSEQMVFGKLG